MQQGSKPQRQYKNTSSSVSVFGVLSVALLAAGAGIAFYRTCPPLTENQYEALQTWLPCDASSFGWLQSWLNGTVWRQPDVKPSVQEFFEEGNSTQAGNCQLSGTIHDSNCDYASVERINRQELLPVLEELVRTAFFRYFKVNLYCDCPFWPDDSMCSSRDCSVCECEPHEVPPSWLAADQQACEGGDMLEEEATVDRRVEPGMRSQLTSIPGWAGLNNPWMPENDGDLDFSYINLINNPERYSGYTGEHPRRIWNLIYSQSCFHDIHNPTACPERRVFYRLISGMHSSITSHIVQEYLLDEASNAWGPNLALFRQRLGNEAVRERVENLYFAYLFVLRAVMKAGPLLERLPYSTGLPEEDARTARLVRQLVENEALKSTCPVPFDEGRLWKGTDAPALMAELQAHFKEMTRAMDCVGCEKCRLWGKLQILGIATSLKILFSSESCDGSAGAPALALERNELIALVNLLERLARSIEIVRDMSAQLAEGVGEVGLKDGSIQGALHSPLQPALR